MVTALSYLPVAVIAVVLAVDLLSVFVFKAVFTFPHEPLGFHNFRWGRRIQFIAMEVIALAIGVPVYFLCRKIVEFEKSTASVLREYANLI